MQSLTVVLLLAFVVPVISFSLPPQKEFYARALAVFTCKGVLVPAQVEFMQANDNEDEHDHIISINSKYGRFDATAHGKKKQSLVEKITFKNTKPDFFLRVHYDCGCGETFDTDFMPRNKIYLSEDDADANPLDYGIVELSKCA